MKKMLICLQLFTTGKKRLLLLFFLIVSLLEGATIKGSDRIAKKSQYLLSNPTQLLIDFPAEVIIRKGDKSSVVITTDDNLHKYINLVEKTDRLAIRFTEGFSSKRGVKIELSLQKLHQLKLEGNLEVRLQDIKEKELSIVADGVIEIDAKNSIVDRLNIVTDGIVDIDFQDLMSYSCYLNLKGSGDVNIFVQKYLSIIAEGNGDIYYVGDPKIDIKSTDIDMINIERKE